MEVRAVPRLVRVGHYQGGHAGEADIGQRFGGRDHTTVMYAVKKIEKNLTDDVSLRGTVDALRKKLEG